MELEPDAARIRCLYASKLNSELTLAKPAVTALSLLDARLVVGELLSSFNGCSLVRVETLLLALAKTLS